MKRKVIILTAFIYSFGMAWAQPSGITVPLDTNLQIVIDMIQINNGNFIIAGKNYANNIVCVTSLTSEGEILWSRYLDGEMEWYSNITEKSNGNVLVPMSHFHAKLIELNPSGDSVGCLIIVEINDSLIIATELIMNNDPWFPGIDSSFLVKIDEEFNVVEEIPPGYKVIKNLTKVSNNEFFALGGNNFHNTLYIKYNLDGQILNATTCSDSLIETVLYRMCRLNNNNFIAIGYQWENNGMKAHLSAFNQSGEVEFCKDYMIDYFMSVTKNETTESIYAIGNENSTCSIYNISYSGNLISAFTLNDSVIGNNIIYDAGSFYIAAFFDPNISIGSRFMKISADSIFLISENPDISKINAYPNPAKECIVFQVSNVKVGSELRIINLVGKEVSKMLITSEKTIWDFSKLDNGIYFYYLEKEGELYSGKIVIKK